MNKLLPKTIIDKYTLTRFIGNGGSSDVWECLDQNDKKWALKIFNIGNGVDDLSRKLFLEEYMKTKALKNKYIITPIEYGEFERSPYLVLPLCESSLMDELKQRILKNKPDSVQSYFSEEEIGKLIFEVCSGLEYLHKKGIIHNDIKPDNILIKENGKTFTYVLSDFGISTRIRKTIVKFSGNKEQIYTSGLSPEYAAPEQFMGRIDFRTDVFAFGVMLYELISGQTPGDITGINIGQTLLHGGEIPDFKQSISLRLKTIIYSMLERDVNKRLKLDELKILAKDFLKEGFWGELAEKLPAKEEISLPVEIPVRPASKSIPIKDQIQDDLKEKWWQRPIVKRNILRTVIFILFGAVLIFGFRFLVFQKKKNHVFELFRSGHYNEAYVESFSLWTSHTNDPELKRIKNTAFKMKTFNQVRPFKNNMAAVEKNKKWGFVDEDGNLIIQTKFDKVIDFEGEYAIVQIGIKEPLCGVVDKMGKFELKPVYTNCRFIDEGKVAVISKTNTGSLKKDTITLSK